MRKIGRVLLRTSTSNKPVAPRVQPVVAHAPAGAVLPKGSPARATTAPCHGLSPAAVTSCASVNSRVHAPTHASAATHPWTVDRFKVPPAEGKTRFHDMKLPVELMHAVADLGFSYCTSVQALALPPTLDGKDVAGRAQTGTGKTAAFLIAIFTHFLRHPLPKPLGNGTPRALILAPTRELAIQIHKDALSLGKYCPFHVAVVYGGMDYRKQQMELAQNRIDLVVATPGRLLDFK
ncbi:MAG: DEAD/DEAH box helicase, partial [Kiritimatiellota bacterium]|nr:DEAD/DEAH box helicase [Kiritimatiellota bacterium]